jgi:hypothetical protein
MQILIVCAFNIRPKGQVYLVREGMTNRQFLFRMP